jgi:hypothetical protein
LPNAAVRDRGSVEMIMCGTPHADATGPVSFDATLRTLASVPGDYRCQRIAASRSADT